MEFSLRPLCASDWPALREMRLEALRTEPGMYFASYDDEVGLPDSHWQRLAASDADGQLFGVFAGGELAGLTAVFVALDDPSRTTAVFAMSYVAPRWRGRGLTRLLYAGRLQWVREHPSLRRIRVSHRRSNERSRRAIERHGFQRTGSRERTWHDGSVEDEVLYELDCASEASGTGVECGEERQSGDRSDESGAGA